MTAAAASGLAARHEAPGMDEMLDRARSLLPALRARAETAEELRRLPEETERDFHATGLYRMLQPRRLGGAELPYGALVALGAEVAKGCASSAWNLTNLASHHWMLAMFPEGAQRRIWDENPDALIASSFIFPAGKARPAPGGYVLSGRWAFSSGVDPSDWNMLAGIVREGDGGPGEYRVFILHKSQYEVIDTWHVTGLKGTGSKDVEAREVFVPAEMSVAVDDLRGGPTPGSAQNPGPLYRLPVFALFPLILSGIGLGNAEACVEAYVAGTRGRASAMTGAKLAELQSTQIKIGASESRTRVARQVMLGICDAAMADAARDHIPDVATKLAYRRDTAFATHLCTEAVDMVYTASGAHALYLKSPMQRQFRDAHAVASHIAFNLEVAMAAYGRVALGLPTDNPTV